MKFVSRGDTTVVDAYLSPILRRYVEQVQSSLGDVRLQFMQSSGGLTDAHRFQGKDAILSGPAGGIVGAAAVTQLAGFDKMIGFDMGGTSTDVTHFAGEYERVRDRGRRVRLRARSCRSTPSRRAAARSARSTAASSASAPRAPAPTRSRGYRRGGPLTVTDCNVMVGKLRPELFPAVFGPGGDQPLDTGAVIAKFAQLAAEVERATGQKKTPEAIAAGFLRIAVENMANAIKAHQCAARLRRHRIHADLLRRRRRPARLPGGRRARHAACSSTRSPACCRPTAWGSPTCARCVRRPSRSRSR